VLVQLVGRRVADPERQRRQLVVQRAEQQRAEDRVLGCVRELAQDEIPGAEPGAEVGDRRFD
jgi:hypothetical protein